MATVCIPYDSSNLTILGVIHRDNDSAPLLADWLERWRPEVLTLEFSAYGLAYREMEGQALRKSVLVTADDMVSRGLPVNQDSLDSVLAYLQPSFEFRVASDYATRHGSPLYLIDDDRFSRARLANIEELVSAENLEKLLSFPPGNECRRERAIARLCLEEDLNICDYTEEMETRDREIRDRIAELMFHHPGARLLHVCGWQHLRDPRNTYGSLNPVKVFIHDKTLCV